MDRQGATRGPMWEHACKQPHIWDMQGTRENLDMGKPLVCKDRRDTWGRTGEEAQTQGARTDVHILLCYLPGPALGTLKKVGCWATAPHPQPARVGRVGGPGTHAHTQCGTPPGSLVELGIPFDPIFSPILPIPSLYP